VALADLFMIEKLGCLAPVDKEWTMNHEPEASFTKEIERKGSAAI